MASIAASVGISLAVSAATAGLTYALTPTEKINQGRLDSLLSGNAAYGTPIPWAWGTVRLPGNRIWQDYLEETRSKSNQGKGSKVEVTDFNYFGYFATLFCECPFRPISEYQRLWFNKKLVYSTIGGAETIAEGGAFADQYLRFYKGEAAQALDPLLQFNQGISNYNYGLPAKESDRNAYLQSLGLNPDNLIFTPAYNYRGYMVAQRLPLDDFFNALPQVEAEIIASENCTLGQIIGDIMSLFYNSDRYDVSLLTTPVQGFTIDSVGAAKNAIQTLQQAYFFDYVYSNGVYKFIPLNHPRDVLHLAPQDLAAHTSGSQKPLDYEIVETDVTKLPSKVVVKYIDPDLDYDVNEQFSALEVKSHYNQNTITLNFPLVLNSSDAATIADRALILAWSQRFLYKFKLSPAHLDIEPADLVVNVFDSRDYPIKITQTRIGTNLIMDCEGVAHDTFFWNLVRTLQEGGVTVGVADYNVSLDVEGEVLTVSDTGGNSYVEGTDYQIDNDGNIEVLGSGNIAEGTSLVVSTNATATQSDPGSINSPGDTELLVLDIPLITNSDEDYTLYMAAGGGTSWTGASIYLSTDDSRYVFAAGHQTYSIYGSATSPISNDQITVNVNRSELESITDADLALGFNLALIGDEIIQFKTAVLSDTNTYILSELTRHLRGTEGAAEIQTGDRFVLLAGENAILSKIIAAQSDIGQVRYLKAVSAGQSLDQVAPVTITYQGISQRPYSPVNLAATKNSVGDITITWDRRDRHDQSENPLLSESTEGYLVELIDNTDNVIRSITTNISSSIYLASDQVTDFGAVQSTITLRIAQVSSTYGVGTYTQTVLTPTLVEPAPTIPSFTPASGQVGATITVTGTNLSQTSTVAIGDIEQNNITVIDNENITFEVAAGTVSGNITLSTTGGTATSNTAFILEQPPQALVFPVGAARSLPYTLTPTDAGLELIISAQTDILSIPDSDAGFTAGWGCWISLDGSGNVTIERESGGTSGILGVNTITDNQTVKLWHRGGNVWKID